MLIEIPPKYSVAQVAGKSGIAMTRDLWGSKKLHRTKLLGERVLCINRWARMKR
jgi:hypothetical protein